MSLAQHQPWTRQQFFDWAGAREERYEFDGFRPVAMTGRTLNHNRISQNLWAALRQRLRGTGCQPFGPDAGIATVGEAVRYPDALITCSKSAGESLLAPDPVVVFEVLSPNSTRTDRIVKLREYQAVESIRRYVIAEYLFAGAMVLEKLDNGNWQATALAGEDILRLPEAGIEIPVAELYEDVEFEPQVG